MSCSIKRHLCKQIERALGFDRLRQDTFILHYFPDMIFKMPFILEKKLSSFNFNLRQIYS